ncbi:MAG: hypothetical protein ACK4SF_04600 [Algoriphagus aquaeductus]|uniref:hypothetical protein n=1 Tax=Algoriphagus aquaeductus TaxID=475299 RepID=UPI00391D59C9
MTANKNDLLTAMLVETLFQQETYLTEEDKKEFPLVERALHTILDIWDTNWVKITSLDMKLIAEGQLLIQVNSGVRVYFMSPLAKEAYATA